MASDLVLRLCQVDEDDGGFPSERHIAVRDWAAALTAVHGGYHSVVQIKTFFDMTPAEQGQFDVLWGKITSAVGLAAQLARKERAITILNLWERKDDLNLSGYDTPDDIETQLLAIDTGF